MPVRSPSLLLPATLLLLLLGQAARADDTLPRRLLEEPVAAGPSAGHVVDLEPMLDEYYRIRGWDVATGLPKRERLERLGLGDIADALEAMGKLAV